MRNAKTTIPTPAEKNLHIGKKRGWMNISIDILESALIPTTKTRLLYRSDLNFARFNVYFQDFLQKGLLREIGNTERNGTTYLVSERGRILLNALRSTEEIFSKA